MYRKEKDFIVPEQSRRVVDQSIDPHKLLEEHESCTDMSPSPAPGFQTVRPGYDFQFESIDLRTIVHKLGMSLFQNLLLKSRFR